MLTLAFFIALFAQFTNDFIGQIMYRGIALSALPLIAVLLWLITRIIFLLHPSDTTKLLKQIYNLDLSLFAMIVSCLFVFYGLESISTGFAFFVVVLLVGIAFFFFLKKAPTHTKQLACAFLFAIIAFVIILIISHLLSQLFVQKLTI